MAEKIITLKFECDDEAGSVTDVCLELFEVFWASTASLDLIEFSVNGESVISELRAEFQGRLRGGGVLSPPRCPCHSGSVCTAACESGAHHEGCAASAHSTSAR